ncbi:MAG: hypothetical protein AAF366_15640 [Pseudomonadota bacterium]
MKSFALLIALPLVAALSACSAGQIVDNTADAAAVTTRAVVQTGVGATKLVYRGGKALIPGGE